MVLITPCKCGNYKPISTDDCINLYCANCGNYYNSETCNFDLDKHIKTVSP